MSARQAALREQHVALYLERPQIDDRFKRALTFELAQLDVFPFQKLPSQRLARHSIRFSKRGDFHLSHLLIALVCASERARTGRHIKAKENDEDGLKPGLARGTAFRGFERLLDHQSGFVATKVRLVFRELVELELYHD